MQFKRRFLKVDDLNNKVSSDIILLGHVMRTYSFVDHIDNDKGKSTTTKA